MKEKKVGFGMVGLVGQWLGLVCLGIGIGIEVVMKAHIGFLAITIGSMLFAVGTKYRYHKNQ